KSSTVTLNKPLTGPELGLLASTARGQNPAEASDVKQYAIRTSEVPLEQLAAGDLRIAKLVAENNRLNNELLRATLRLAQTSRQRKALEDQGVGTLAPAATPAGDFAEMIRRVEIMRRTITKLAEENRWHTGTAKELQQLRAENQQLKARVTATAVQP